MTEQNSVTRGSLSRSRPTPLDLVSFLPYACKQLQAPFVVRVVQTTQDEYVSKTDEKSKKIGKQKSGVNQQTSRTLQDSRESEDSTPVSVYADTDTILITAVVDVVGRLIELLIQRCIKLPRLLIKIIGICIPYQMFLNKINIRWVPLEGEIIYEITKFLPQSSLTDINFDDTPVPERNYYLLVDHPQLKCLSLARCNIDDEDCLMIASRLTHPLPAATHLIVLSLVSNDITDVGAAALGKALRSNTSLQYLNLSGNQISNPGAIAVLQSLMQFNLMQEELIMKRQRLMEYLKVKREIYHKCLKELMVASEKSHDEFSRSSKRKPTIGRKKTSLTATSMGVGHSSMDTVIFKAETMTNELVGTYADPFSFDKTEKRDNCIYSVGNMTLCYLNLSHNRLGYTTLSVILQVLKYQSLMTQKSGSGLLRVIIDGNDLPIACSEYSVIDELLDRAVMLKIAKSAKRVERAKSKVK